MASAMSFPSPHKSISELKCHRISELALPLFRCRSHLSLYFRIVSLRKQMAYAFSAGCPFPISELLTIIMSKFRPFSVFLPEINSEIGTSVLTNRALEIF